MTQRSFLFRPLPLWAAAVASLLTFGVVSGLLSALAEILGVARHWAFAIGWNAGFALLLGRYYIIATDYSRAMRWRAFGFQLGLMILVSLIVTSLWGARIFAPAT